MFKVIVFLFLSCVSYENLFSYSSTVSEILRKNYALKFHEAFILQSAGLSTQAFYLFKDAYQEALHAGEKLEKLIAMDELFRWYRTYGSMLRLFGREPTGNDRIVSFPGRFRSLDLSIPVPLQSHPKGPHSKILNFESKEWDNIEFNINPLL